MCCARRVLSPFITRTSGIPMETQANPLVQEKSLGLKEWKLGIDEVFVAEATGLIGRFSSLSPPPPSSCPFLKVEHFARAGPSLGSPIYRVSEGINTIFHGEISVQRNIRRNPQKLAISCDI